MSSHAQNEGTSAPQFATPRRWPAALACFALACALVLTGALFNLDRENVASASSSPSNAARDTMAIGAFTRLSFSFTKADQLHRVGVLGMRQVATHAFRSTVVNPLGGTFFAAPTSWTLALNGGWACLALLRTDPRWFVPNVSRGVCGNTAIQATPSVSAAAIRRALGQDARMQRAALDAADVSESLESANGTLPSFTLMALGDTFSRWAHPSFTATVTDNGVTVHDGDSWACAQPTANQEAVTISLGPCPQEDSSTAG